MESETRELLNKITEVHQNRFKQIAAEIKTAGLTTGHQSELKTIAAHCLAVEKLLIEEASKLAATLPEFRQTLLAAQLQNGKKK